MADDFDKKTSLFLEWLAKMGVRISPMVSLVDFRAEGRGRGLVATADIKDDELLFSIPRTSVLNVQNFLDRSFDSNTTVSPQALKGLPAWASLTAVVIHEMSRQNSEWYPYLAVLPSKLDSLIFWTLEELAELQASEVVNKIGRSDAENMYRQSIAAAVSANENIELFHLIASTIMAYAFDVPLYEDMDECHIEDEFIPDDDETTVLSMIPLADMLNADANRNNARLSCDKEEELEMRAIKSIKRGEEIFNDYGELPRSDLLRRYGYITDNYTKYDVVEMISRSIVGTWKNSLADLSELQVNERLELAKREGILEDSYDIGYSDSEIRCIPDELVALVYLMTLDDSTVRSIQDSEMSLPSRSRMETDVVGKMITQFLELREKEYHTTLEEDKAILGAGDCPLRLEMAIQVRLSEKQILREAMKEAATFQAKDDCMKTGTAKRGRELERVRSNKRGKII